VQVCRREERELSTFFLASSSAMIASQPSRARLRSSADIGLPTVDDSDTVISRITFGGSSVFSSPII
jgi:hypothetical protein